MEQNETLELNKLIVNGNMLIAKFMGIKCRVSSYDGREDVVLIYPLNSEGFPYPAESAIYHTSWDWQIPAYSKAMHTFRDIITPLEKDEHLCTLYNQLLNAYESAIFTNNVQYGFDTLVKIIKIINANNPK